jgi:hypothetical protein
MGCGINASSQTLLASNIMAKQFPDVNCTYGSPMGRAEYGIIENCVDRSIRVFKVRLNGDYDDGGAYWGSNSIGSILYCATDDSDYRHFIRASDRVNAIIKLDIPSDKLIRR